MTRCGCLEFCCKGCNCCVDKNKIITELKAKIETQQQKILELLTRNTTIGEGGNLAELNARLKRENELLKMDANRLRNERNIYRQQRNEIRTEKEELNEELNILITAFDRLKEQITQLKRENQELKSQIERVSALVVNND